MRKNRFLTLIPALLCAACLFSSCKGGTNPPADTEATEPENQTVTVTFLYRDGREAVISELNKGDTVTEPEAPTRAEYTFGGWYLDADLTVPATFDAVTADRTYYAQWVPSSACLVRFQSCGGSAVANAVAAKGGKVAAPDAPEREGYTFGGWYTDAAYTTRFNFDNAVEENMTLYAMWNVASGYLEVTGYIDGEQVIQTVVKKDNALEPLCPNVNLSYLWYTDSAMTDLFDFTAPQFSRLSLYGVAFSAGLTIENGTVLSYTGRSETVTVPAKWEGKAVTAIADKAFAGNTEVEQILLPETIQTVGAGAFSGCTRLRSVNLTEACTAVGAYAFNRCERLTAYGTLTGLTKVANGTFLGCTALTEVVLSEAVTEIGEYAFSGCTALTAVDLGDKITRMGDYAFSDCVALKQIHLSTELTALGDGALVGCAPTLEITGGNRMYRVVAGNLYGNNGKTLLLYVPGEKASAKLQLAQGVNSIGANAFYGNSTVEEMDLTGITLEFASLRGMKALRTLTIDDLSAGYLAYYFGASGSGLANGVTGVFTPATLETVHIKQELSSLGDYAFYGVTGLKQVTGISKIRGIGAYAFAYTAIENLQIPAGTSAIQTGAFNRCENLSSFTVEEGNQYFSVYDGCLYDKAQTTLLIVPRLKTEIQFAPTVRTIATGAFYKSHIRAVVVPDTVTSIQSGAFANADHMEELTVPYIGGSASQDNYMIFIFGGSIVKTSDAEGNPQYTMDNTGAAPASLKTLTITASLSEIPDFAFAYLQNVTAFNLTGSIQKIGMYAYLSCGLKELVIPNTVQEIGEFAFAYMSNLISVTVPGSVGASLGSCAFYGNRSLETVRFEEGVTVIPEGVLYPYAATDSTTGSRTYSSALKEIYLPSTVTSIGNLAFAFAGTVYSGTYQVSFSSEFKFVLAPGSQLTTIADRAFYMSSITELTLPASVKTVGEFAFGSCQKLASVTFGDDVNGSALEKLGGACFANCTGLNTLTIYKRVTSTESVPVLEQYVYSSDETPYNIFAGTEAPAIYVYGASYYKAAQYWDSYEQQIFEIRG